MLASQDAAAAEGRLRALMRQLGAAGLRVSPLDWQGTDFKFELLPQVRTPRSRSLFGALCDNTNSAQLLEKCPASPPPPPSLLQWCDTAGPQLDSAGADYCGPATSYRGVPLTFENLVEASEAA